MAQQSHNLVSFTGSKARQIYLGPFPWHKGKEEKYDTTAQCTSYCM